MASVPLSASCDALAQSISALCVTTMRSDPSVTPMDVANILATLSGTLFGVLARENAVAMDDGTLAVARLIAKAFESGHEDAGRAIYLNQLHEGN